MSLQPSIRRRQMRGQSVRQGMPAPWMSALSSKFLNINVNGNSCTASATANTPGAWVQYLANNAVASTDTIHCVHLQAIGNNQAVGADNSMLLDIGIGAAGSETVIASNIAIGGAANSNGIGPFFYLPIRIPGATRVALRVRAATGSRVLTVQVIAFTGAPALSSFSYRLPTTVDTLGTNTATSTGTAMSGASGTWTQITEATTVDYQALIVLASGPASITGASQTEFRLDLGLGSAGNEQDVAFTYAFYTSNGFIAYRTPLVLSSIYGGFVPAGTRISVRHNLAANPERVCACVIGVPYV